MDVLRTRQRPRSRSGSSRSAQVCRAGILVVGVYFAGTAVLNTTCTVRHARDFMRWLADNSWLPPYRLLFRTFEPVAPVIVLGAAAFQATVAYHLLRGRRVSGALTWAQAWVLGLIPALPWPYWTVNAVSAAAFEALRRGAVHSEAFSVRV